MDSVIRPSNNRGLEVIADIDVSFQHPAQQLLEGVSAIHLSNLPSSAYLDIDVYGAPKTISSLHVGVQENAQATNEKLLKLLISGGNRFAIEKIPQE